MFLLLKNIEYSIIKQIIFRVKSKHWAAIIDNNSFFKSYFDNYIFYLLFLYSFIFVLN